MEAPVYQRRWLLPVLQSAGLLIVLGLVLLSLCVGPGDFSPTTVLKVIANHLSADPESDTVADVILWQLRIPRTILVWFVGASLAMSGGITQGMFRNPLADPGVLGISAGAAAAVVGGIACGIDEHALWITPTLAICGSAGVLLILVTTSIRSEDIASLLLTGVAMSAILVGATTCLLSLTMDDWNGAQRAVVWLLGSFDGRGWEHVKWGLPPLILGQIAGLACHRSLDVLVLGEETAVSLGTHMRKMKLGMAVVIAVLCGASTALVGAIGFVGLVVPHVVRMCLGPAHSRLLRASIFVGGAMMILVDVVSRALSPIYVAPGALTSLLGGAFFLWLVRRRQRGVL